MSDKAPVDICVFFQPKRNVRMLADVYRVNVFVGPEVENAKSLSATDLANREAEWMAEVAAVGAGCVLKRPRGGPLPGNCVGVMMTIDEPNGKYLPGTTTFMSAADVKADSDRLRALYPGVPVWLSLAGDKVSGANLARPPERRALAAWGDVADVLTTDFYEKNRNEKYEDTMSGDIAAKLRDATGRRVVPWYEINDQQLDPPPAGQGINRAPTAIEVRRKIEHGTSLGLDAAGIFATCQKGKYGWAPDPARPNRGDSYWPRVNRFEQSIDDVLAELAKVCQELRPKSDDVIRALQAQVAAALAEAAEAKTALAAALEDKARAIELAAEANDQLQKFNAWLAQMPGAGE